jgi:hypothetical protein
VRVDRLTIFSHLWAIAGLCEWTRWTFTETGWSWMVIVAAGALFLAPNSVAALATFAAVQAIFTAVAANRPWNHGLFMALINATILASIVHWWLSGRRAATAADREALVETFAPPLRLGLIALYLLTFFHKLNADFVNPEVSCAGWLLDFLGERYRVVPVAEWSIVGSIWATFLVELTVPLLLCFRRTAYAGLAIGAGFHLFLSQFGGLHGFAAMLFTLYFLFLPKAFTDGLAARVARWPAPRLAATAIGVAMLLVVWKLLGSVAHLPHIYRGLVLWDVWLLAVVVGVGGALLRTVRIPADFGLRPRWAPLWALPIVIVLNGLSPYVGLKTETSWAMYSNLRTEIRPNHFVVPASAKLFGFQDDLVAIVDTSLPALAEYAGSDTWLTFFELRRLCSAATQDFAVTYRRGGETRTLTVTGGVASDPEACRPHPWLVSKLLRFRPVDTGAHATWRH